MSLRNGLQVEGRRLPIGPRYQSISFDELTDCRIADVYAIVPKAFRQRLRYDLTVDINRDSGCRGLEESFAVGL